jgi:hypothetical protein
MTGKFPHHFLKRGGKKSLEHFQFFSTEKLWGLEREKKMLRICPVFQYRKDVRTRTRALVIENTLGNGWWLTIDRYLSYLLDTRDLYQQKEFWFRSWKILKQLVMAKSKCTFSFRDAFFAACVETANVSNKRHKILIFQTTWDRIKKFGNCVRMDCVFLPRAPHFHV